MCVKILICEVYIDPGNPGKPQCLPHAQLLSLDARLIDHVDNASAFFSLDKYLLKLLN